MTDTNRPNADKTSGDLFSSLTPKETSYEEFDISKFDFTIRDPGEDPAPAPSAEPSRPAPAPEEPPRSGKGVEGGFDFTPVWDGRKKKKSPPPEVSEPLSSTESISDGPVSLLKIKGRRYLRYALQPAGLYENISESLWWLFLLGACLFFGGFYLLVGMDWLSAGLISAGRVWAFLLTGGLVGGIAALSFSGMAALTAKVSREDAVSPFRMLSAVAGSAVLPALLLGVGFLLSLFGLSVSLSFGVIALLWWIFSLTEMLKTLFAPRYLLIVSLITLWGFGLFALITVTFSLK